MRRFVSVLIFALFLPAGFGLAQQKPSLAGRTARLVLLSPLSSKSPNDSPFLARLESPIEVEGVVVLPEGTLFAGRVKIAPSGWLRRSGSLLLVFETISRISEASKVHAAAKDP